MTLSSLSKLREREGVTLVELLVVILIVTILAVTLLPMFQRYVVEAQYAAEPIPLIGHIRTQIGLYQYENNALPEDEGATSPSITYIGKGVDGTFNVYRDTLATSYPGYTTPVAGKYYLGMMGLSLNEFIGKKVTPDQVEYVCLKNDGGYGYAIGVFGRKGGLPQGTGYAVCEYYYPDVAIAKDEKGYKLVGTWKYYGKGLTGDDSHDNRLHFTLGTVHANGSCALFAWTEPTNLSALQSTIDSHVDPYWQFPKVVSTTTP